jgi:hypothetical protein
MAQSKSMPISHLGMGKSGPVGMGGSAPASTNIDPLNNPPSLLTHTPANGATLVATTTPVTATFDKDMNIHSFHVTSTPDPGGWVPSWSNNKTVSVAHTAFASEGTYTIDLDCNDPNGTPITTHSFSFTCADEILPTVLTVSPLNAAVDVAKNADVVVTFSEKMSTAGADITITGLTGTAVVWSVGDTVATISHDVWASDAHVAVTVRCKDEAGNNMAAPKAWAFDVVDWSIPTITSTVPVDDATGVARDASVVLNFSEKMDPTSLVLTGLTVPVVTWSVGDTKATITHTAFASEAHVDVTVNCNDDATIPNPMVEYAFDFDVVDYVAPTVVSTVPTDNATGVVKTDDIVITFDEKMTKASLALTSTPTITGQSVVWSVGDTVATISHDALVATGQHYDCSVTCSDEAGNPMATPYLWDFDVADTTLPTVVSTAPADNDTAVIVDSVILVYFSEPMDTTTLTFTCAAMGGLSYSWQAGDTVLRVDHTIWTGETHYDCTVTCSDKAGNAMAAPYAWDFDTADIDEPEIVPPTVPTDNETGVAVATDIVITFDEPMDTVLSGIGISPDPGGVTPGWTVGNTVLTVTHTAFASETHYDVLVDGKDVAGNTLVQVPFDFTSIDTGLPTLVSFTPTPDQAGFVATNAVVSMTFSEKMDTATFAAAIAPDPGGQVTTWSVGDTVATIAHTAFTNSVAYAVTITVATDDSTNSMAGLPYHWDFQVTP